MSSSSCSLLSLRPEVVALKKTLDDFVENRVIPCEAEFAEHLSKRHGDDRFTMEAVPPCVERLKQEAKQLGLWNLFIPPRLMSHVPDEALKPQIPLSYREYGILCETMGRCPELAPMVCNCGAPDTGNMEVLMEFGTPAQKEKYLLPLLRGEIRSTFLMTEPDVSSSDPTNLSTTLKKRIVGGNVEYTLTGNKWWSTGAGDPRCRVAVVVARTDTSGSSNSNKHLAHTIVLVGLPHPGVKVKRALTVMGYDDAPYGHAQVELNAVSLNNDDLVLGEGSGFRVSQARLGPGRIHHCMRAIGMAARSYELMLQRAMERRAFGKYLWEHGGCQEMIADSASDVEAARLLTLSCASALDDVGPRIARDKIASIKVTVPELCYRVVDRSVQVHGGAGLSEDFPMAKFLAGLRSLRIADGPDAVHRRTLALLEIRKAKKRMQDELKRSRL
ncbi:Acyl-CoA dehydrogenase family member 11 [Seminavis robusta]|uniref:Acyl-CoA dehydrogenase family member 11 n=1 Tax=Seminavis robusta TaxID=568900 RepID=A0A9N8EWU1_9STRA|nr:Acyl-CoA dehydrogenase family member 11 [Seminavis robusta]|eukprot:Sro1993_g309920.1 Acyl-CoA dehydrogenase family member 11 (444) ;mRNA; r:11564-13089